jgi:hypothetical protein
MAHQDDNGIWREDKFRSFAPEPDECENCGSLEIEYDLMPDWDEIDGKLMDAWAGEALPAPYDQDERELFFSRMWTLAQCEECGHCMEYGAIGYYNPETNWYDLPRPLTPDEARKAALEAERLQQESAGQQRLL